MKKLKWIFVLCLIFALTAIAGIKKPANESKQMPIVRETYEWSNNWWDHASDPTLPRVLLIGDSISIGYSSVVTEQLKGKVYVDRMANSRGVHDPFLFKEIRVALEEGDYRVIQFNNGLHAFHLSDAEYATQLEKYLQMIIELKKGATLIWANSTPVTQPVKGLNDIVIRRNAIAEKIMKAHHIQINDLYSRVIKKNELRVENDGFHYNHKGYQVLGTAVAEQINGMLK